MQETDPPSILAQVLQLFSIVFLLLIKGLGAASGGFPVFQASDGQAAVGDVAVYPAADGAFVGNIHSLAVISLDDEMED